MQVVSETQTFGFLKKLLGYLGLEECSATFGPQRIIFQPQLVSNRQRNPGFPGPLPPEMPAVAHRGVC